MTHYKVTEKSKGDLDTLHPHSPEDFNLSLAEYLEDEFAEGWEFISHASYTSNNTWTLIFKANGQP